jgi:hypothetical protein
MNVAIKFRTDLLAASAPIAGITSGSIQVIALVTPQQVFSQRGFGASAGRDEQVFATFARSRSILHQPERYLVGTANKLSKPLRSPFINTHLI